MVSQLLLSFIFYSHFSSTASLTRAYETLQASVETRNAKSSRLLNQVSHMPIIHINATSADNVTQATTVSHNKLNERKMSWNDLSTLSSELPPPHQLMPSFSTPVSTMASVPEEIEHAAISSIEFDVTQVTNDKLSDYIQKQVNQVENLIKQGHDVVIYTSRDVIKTEDLNNNLSISTNISNALVAIIQGLTIQPRFIIAKGGITSSDVATKGLNIKKAKVIGQITQGVPVWLTGDEAKYSHMPYVIFPGNIGEESTLTEVYQINSKDREK